MKGRYGGYPLFLPIFQSLRNFAETLVKNKIIKYSANFSLVRIIWELFVTLFEAEN